TGALFVIAAGNDGEYGARTVAAPAAADAALAVGAVDDNDGLAPFSSRGPRMTDYALKPEIAAPGVEISAARAGGRDSDAYTTMSGTSMAAPHVAGAAAILVQQHPDWTGEQIKAALTGTATDAGHSVYQQGAGRLDIAAAVRTTVLPSVKVDFGRTQWPHDEAPVSRTVTYRNVGDEPVTLTLSTTLKTESGDRAPEGMLTVAPAVITVPPGGTADATVTLDDTLGPVGLYTGAVTATGPGVALRTPVGLFKEPRGFELTVKVAERAGATTSANGAVIIRRIDREENEWVILPPAGSAHLFEGVYAVHSALAWADDAGDLDNLALLADPQVTLDRDRTLTLDPNAAKKVEVITDRPTEAFDTTQNFWHIPAGSTTPFGVVHRGLPYGVQLWVTPTRQVTVGKFFFEHLHLAGTPAITVRVPELGNRLLHARYQHYAATIPKLDGRLTLRVVDAGRGSAAEFARIDARGKIALIDIGDRALAPLLGHQFPREELLNAARAGAAAVFAYGNEGLPVLGQVAMLSNTYPLPTLALPADEGRALRDRLARGPATAWIDSQPSIPHLYNLAYLDRGAIPDPPRYRVADDQLVTLRQAFHGDRPTAYLYRATVTWPGLLGLDYDASWSYVDLDGIAGPFTRTEHVGPVSAEPLRYRSVSTHELGSWLGEGSTVSNALGNRETVDVFDRPLAKDERWGHAPSVPGVAVVDGADRMGMDGPLCGACRFSGLLPDGDMLALFTLTTDSDGHYGELTGYSNHPLDPERTGVDEWRLYADGVELPQHSLLGIPGLFPYFVLPAGATTYRLTQHFEDWLPEGGYGNKADTTWTFASQPPTGKQVPDGYDSLGLCVDGCRVEPLIFLRYDFTLRQDNRVSAPGAHLFTVTPYRQPSTAAMPRIAGLKVSVSVDGGRHWAPVPTVRLPNGEYLVVVVHSKVPGPNATVSLRTEAWDAVSYKKLTRPT
ncbi:MAG: S8 family serine peptidase, partial [Dactylosporangium sp.]|nr:S8 family serine peptidase [Dactylosporangium sp.]